MIFLETIGKHNRNFEKKWATNLLVLVFVLVKEEMVKEDMVEEEW